MPGPGDAVVAVEHRPPSPARVTAAADPGAGRAAGGAGAADEPAGPLQVRRLGPRPGVVARPAARPDHPLRAARPSASASTLGARRSSSPARRRARRSRRSRRWRPCRRPTSRSRRPRCTWWARSARTEKRQQVAAVGQPDRVAGVAVGSPRRRAGCVPSSQTSPPSARASPRRNARSDWLSWSTTVAGRAVEVDRRAVSPWSRGDLVGDVGGRGRRRRSGSAGSAAGPAARPRRARELGDARSAG